MKTEWSLTQAAFEQLLTWLDQDRERAGEKYEEIRQKLIRIFARRGCQLAEELTDETINRVTRKSLEIAKTYEGDPRLYFYGVAQNVYLEYVKQRPAPPPFVPVPPDAEEKERRLDCLDRCMDSLDPESRELIREYFQHDKQAKIDHRKRLADRLGIAVNALRMRACRIKGTLQNCVGDCLNQRPAS